MSNETYQIVELAVRLVTMVLVVYVVPFVVGQIKDNKTISIVRSTVKSVQQKYWDKDGTFRKATAVKEATELLNSKNIRITEEQLSNLIEACVQEMHIEKGDLK